jgi:hypothetical protein
VLVILVILGIISCVAAKVLIPKVKKLKQRKKTRSMSTTTTTTTAFYENVKQESPQMKGRSEAKAFPTNNPSDTLESQYENTGHNVPG